MAIFSEVASACMSTTMASATRPKGQSSSALSTAAKGSSRLSMWTRPSRLTTRICFPEAVSNSWAPRPGASEKAE